MGKNKAKKEKQVKPAKYLIVGFAVCALIWGGLYVAYRIFHGSKYHYFEQGAVVGIAILGAGVSLYTTDKQEENVDKWNQKKIDADLKANARIEWIQRVREATSEFVTSCYMVIGKVELEKEKIAEKLSTIREKGCILKLYFGNDKKEHNCKDAGCNIWLCKYNNDGKHDYINKRIDKILEYFFGSRLSKAQDVAYEWLLYDIADEYLNRSKKQIEEDFKEGSVPNEVIENSGEYKNLLNIEKDLKDKVMKELDELVDIIRLYLKIEWDRAKDNKD